MRRIFITMLISTMVLLFLPLYGFAQSGTQTGGEDNLKPNIVFDMIVKDKFSFQTIAGILYSPVYKRSSRPEINYVMTDLRFIWGLNPEFTVKKLNLEGNIDFILELTHSFIFEGAGSVVSGVTCLFRYNFPFSTDSIFPYIQAGGGVIYNDAYKDRSQILIGNNIEYNPQISIGVRYLFEKNWSMDFEAMFHHLSNGGSDERNTSVNAIGALIGITRYF
ncbi:MAG: acyloxyacyl hydrolase [Desulfobacterium sp.]|nr:acyloxyacyl hydrolase [Desulfobacterium sp.]MBU3949208.1 acyloxyacyl hydrolase [Pseudomonadota bacterium]